MGDTFLLSLENTIFELSIKLLAYNILFFSDEKNFFFKTPLSHLLHNVLS